MVARRPLLGGILAGIASFGSNPAQADDLPPSTAPATAPATLAKSIWRSFYAGTRVWGYADRHSVDAGQTFNLMLSTGPGRKSIRGAVEISRIGHHPVPGAPDRDRKLVWRSAAITVEPQVVQITAAAIGAGWPAGLEPIATNDWQSGYYAIDFIDGADNNRDQNVAYIVVTDKARSGDILLVLSTNTWQAYNEFGGYSLYASDFIGDSAQAVSFDRPAPPDFFEHEYFLALWLERLAAEHGWKLDYAANFDIHRDPVFTERYPLLISGSHNEYWSLAEFKAVHRRIFTLGKSTIFMGANTAYWQVRYGDVNGGSDPARLGRQLVCFKSGDDPAAWRDQKPVDEQITTLFREEARWPETMLTGVAFQSYFSQEIEPPLFIPYFVASTDLPFFAGTGYEVGASIGNLVGYEWDNRDPEGDGARLWKAGVSRIPAIDPATIQVLFHGKVTDIDGKPGLAEAVYFRSPAGAKVFSSGSIRWAWGLGKPDFASAPFQLFNAQLVTDFLQQG